MRQTVAVGTGDFTACLYNQKRIGSPREIILQWKIYNRSARGQTAIPTAM